MMWEVVAETVALTVRAADGSRVGELGANLLLLGIVVDGRTADTDGSVLMRSGLRLRLQLWWKLLLLMRRGGAAGGAEEVGRRKRGVLVR